MAAISGAQEAAAPSESASAPTITATLDGPREAVFETPRQSCDGNDVPDAMARAFRDYAGTIHFSTASSELFESLGPTLQTLQHDCDHAYNSANDPNPADFNDQVWIDSFYTLDGKNIAALSHTEYHGWAIAGECNVQGNNQYSACEYDSDTYHFSTDGGYHFEAPEIPGNFLAGVPWKYKIDDGPIGYSVDSNIVELGGWYYAIATSWNWPPNCSGTTGPNRCITSGGAPLRTRNVFDPSSWRTWDGKDFSVSFVDPYLAPVANPYEHIFTPVAYMGFVNGLNIYAPKNLTWQSGNLAVATLWDYWDDELGTPGMYLTTSTDMIHWTKPTLVVTLKEILANDPKGSWLYAYFSLIDPDAPDLSFSIIGDHPYLYYVRLDNNGQDRVLFRQRLSLQLNQ
jgi:hypothetical protein